MKNKYVFVALMLVVILAVSFGFTNIYVSHTQAEADEEFVVVTSFYPMYIAAMNVIGETEGVTLKNLSEPQTGCLHDFQLTPADMKLLSTADVFIINGGGIESFIEEIAAQYPDLVIIEACDGIELLCDEHEHEHEDSELDKDEHVHEGENAYDEEDPHAGHDHGNLNAHAWMSVELYRKQISNIADGLAQADEVNSASYLANQKLYDGKLSELQQLQEEIRQLFAENNEVVLLHCAYDYLALDYKLDVAYCMDLDEERQVSAGEVAEVIEVVEHHGVKYILAEELYAKDMCNLIQKEVDVEVIYLDPLTRGEYTLDSYLKAMRKNIDCMKSAITN